MELATSHQREGITLVEMIVGLVLLAAVLSGVFSSLDSGIDTMHTATSINVVEAEANRMLHRILQEIMAAGRETLQPLAQPPDGSSRISFRRSAGVVDGEIQWGPEISMSMEPDTHDPVDGFDNNGNGLVDEGMLVWRHDVGQPDELERIWLRGIPRFLQGETDNDMDDNGNGLVDEAGLSFSVEGSTVTVRLSLSRRGSDGRMVLRTTESSVTLLN